MEPAPAVGMVFFPLDEELEIPPGHLTSHAHHCLVRLGAWMPFAHAAKELEHMLGVQVSKSTVRRETQAAGRALLVVQNQQADPLYEGKQEKREKEQLLMSADGAMAPVVGGAWVEVKMLTIGEVVAKKTEEGEYENHTQNHTHFARLADANTFADQASGEIKRRGIAACKEVAAVQDGAVWLQGFVDSHRKDAVRILDFAHAAEYVSAIVTLVRETGLVVPQEWLLTQLHQLKHRGPEAVLFALETLCQPVQTPEIQAKMVYLQKRKAHMHYPLFQADGWPIGSGTVESANKVLMQARLKGSGMHWKRENINPMLALRMAIFNHRWEEEWQQQQQERQRQHTGHRLSHLSHRQQVATQQFLLGCLLFLPPARKDPETVPLPQAAPSQGASPSRPAANHPWRKAFSPAQRAKAQLAKK